MKTIIQEDTQDTILTNDITEQHIVVAIIYEQPCILSKGWGQDESKLQFNILVDSFMFGNGYDFSPKHNTIKKMVEKAMKDSNNKVAVFHQSDWKQALQWLIDNA